MGAKELLLLGGAGLLALTLLRKPQQELGAGQTEGAAGTSYFLAGAPASEGGGGTSAPPIISFASPNFPTDAGTDGASKKGAALATPQAGGTLNEYLAGKLNEYYGANYYYAEGNRVGINPQLTGAGLLTAQNILTQAAGNYGIASSVKGGILTADLSSKKAASTGAIGTTETAPAWQPQLQAQDVSKNPFVSKETKKEEKLVSTETKKEEKLVSTETYVSKEIKKK